MNEMRTKKRIRKLLAGLLILGQVFLLTGCLLRNMDPTLETAPKFGANAIISRNSVSRSAITPVSHNMARYNVEGTNAFYIPEGLENDPESILSFELLDYTDNNELIYHFITPAYITVDEVNQYNNNGEGSEGDAPTTGFKDVERKDYPVSDAELLMAYNPDTGHYRIMMARGYELEWDPKFEERPSYYSSPIPAGGKSGLVFMEQRAYACKVPEKREYLITGIDGIGTIYDERGKVIRTLDFRHDIVYQHSMAEKNTQNEREAAEKRLDPEDKYDRELFEMIEREKQEKQDTEFNEKVKMIIKDVAISKDYYAYVSCSTYTGSSPLDPNAILIGTTFLSYSVGLNREDEVISDYLSFNLNADKQFEAWKSLNGKYFNSIEEMEATYGYSMEKTKMEGAYPDNFTPFYYDAGDSVSSDVAMGKTGPKSLIVGTSDLSEVPVEHVTEDDQSRIGSFFGLNEDEEDELEWYIDDYDSSDEDDRERLLSYWRNKATNAGKKAFRAIDGLNIERLLRKDSEESGGTYGYFVWMLNLEGQVPRMGVWNKDKAVNEFRTGADGNTPESYHILSFSHRVGDQDVPHIADIDPIELVAEGSEHFPDTEYTEPVPLAYLPEAYRTVWYRSGEEARTLRNIYFDIHPELQDTVNAIRDILLDVESDPESGSENVFRILKDVTGDEETAAAETLEYLNELLEEIPSDDREYILNLCLDYIRKDDSIESNRYPISYGLRFPRPARATVNKDMDTNTSSGSTLTGVKDGVIIARDSDKEINNLGYISDFFMFSGVDSYVLKDTPATPGAPREVREITWKNPENGEETRYFVYCTTYGARFYRRNEYSEFEFVDFTGPIKDIYLTFKPDGRQFGDWNTKGFIPYENLLSSSGYTRDTENKTWDSVQEILDKTLSENTTDVIKDETIKESLNDRYIGSIASADSFALIDSDTALICAVNGGTLFLNLNSGEVTKEIGTGSYYRLIQKGQSNDYKLIGFDNDEYSYKECDLPLAKIYDRVYDGGEKGEKNTALIASVKETLRQMAKDYLYRQYRTEIGSNDTVVNIKMPDSEKEENISEEKLFYSGSPEDTTGEFMTELKRLEELYGIKGNPTEITNYLYYLRGQAAALKPAITRLYVLAGATELSTSGKREEAYWKNLDSRITMALNQESLKDILVEIRMHPEVSASLPPEQVQKYDEYRKVLDFTAEQGKVENGKYDFTENLSSNEAEQKFEEAELRSKYRLDVLKDIEEDYSRLYPDGDFEKTLMDLLNKVNPENLILEEEEVLYEFIDLLNHGESVLTEELYKDVRERLKEAIPGITSVWGMEELIISEKVKQPKFEKYSSLYEEYLKECEKVTAEERPPLLRKTEFYKDIIGGLKADSFVKDFLAAKKETWEDYIREVILNAGSGMVKDDKGLIEGSPYNAAIEEWRNLSK